MVDVKYFTSAYGTGAVLALYSHTESVMEPACKYPNTKWIRILSQGRNMPEAVTPPPKVEEVSAEEAQNTIFELGLRERELPIYKTEEEQNQAICCHNCKKAIAINQNYIDGTTLQKNKNNHLGYGKLLCISCFEKVMVEEMKAE